jgi:Tol biopolymer transport system component
MRENTLLAQPFDTSSFTLTGSPTAIARDVQMLLGDARGMFSASDTGSLLYLDGASSSSTTLAWFDDKGTRLTTVGEIGSARGLRLSPDGRMAAIGIINAEDRLNLWTVDLATNTRHQLTFTHDGGVPFVTWSPDGKAVAYGANRDSTLLIAQRPSSGGAEDLLFTLPADQKGLGNPRVSSWTNDGSTLVYSGSGVGGIWTLPIGSGPGKRSAKALVTDPTTAQNPRLSPDQRWFVYQASYDKGSTLQIFVDAFPGGGRRQEVAARGTIALWGPDGHSLYYADDNILTELSVTESDGALHLGPPRAIMPIMVGRGFSYDVAKDGRILALVTSAARATHPLTLLQNWPRAAGLAGY